MSLLTQTYPKPHCQFEESPREDYAIFQIISSIERVLPPFARENAPLLEHVRVPGHCKQEGEANGSLRAPVLLAHFVRHGKRREVGEP